MAVDLAEVKARLNSTTSANDFELLELIDAAEAEYRRLIGPLDVATFVEVRTGWTLLLNRRPVVALTSVTDASGATVTGATVDTEAGIVSVLSPGTYTVTYTAGYVTLPANIRELIVADVAGYYTATQRGGGALRPNFPGEGFAEGNVGAPMMMWPRIHEAARRYTGFVA